MAFLDPPPSGSEDVPTSQTRVITESEKVQALSEAPSTTGPDGGSFDDVAREALRAAKEIIREDGSSATPSTPVVLTKDPPIVVEEQEDLTPLGSDIPSKPTLPTLALTQTTPGSEHSTPIIHAKCKMDDFILGKNFKC